MKKRFKKAVFAFFKDEILESFESKESVTVETITHTMEYVELKSVIDLTERHNPDPMEYERSLEQMRRALFDESMKHLIVNTRELFDYDSFGCRRIQASLFIGVKKL